MRAFITRTSLLVATPALVLPLLLAAAPAHAAEGHAAGKATTAVSVPTLAKPRAKQGSLPSRRTDGRGTLVALPPIVQPGTTPAAPPSTSQVVATFEPVRPGQAVVLERRLGDGWHKVARRLEDTWGSAAFAAPPGTYRARTETSRGRDVVTGRVVSQDWVPTFEDTFSGTTLDSSVWNDQPRARESVWAPRTCARTDPAARRVEGGVLHLGVVLDPELLDQRCHYTTDEGAGEQSFLLTSQVATEKARLFGHGILAARMKPQQAKGMHSSFWLLPQDTSFTDGDPSAGTEIDVMEFFGSSPNGRDTIGSFVTYYESGWSAVKRGALFGDARRALSDGARWWEEFHVFSVEWTPEEYIFRVDGREYHRETESVSLAQQYLVLSMLASDHELDDLTPDELDDTAQVDWVRVYNNATSTTSR
ncbi:glycoside hydrolase family 16 protein [Nocardioides sp.]|uniref:glycoside hydrolase family 16 protein n=1 Tax=Nocardioides sp. TaxID=35761 RepID=UPI00286D91C6|nr:glycoside hydrolase family 16 protein [Nocardioides sp.]